MENNLEWTFFIFHLICSYQQKKRKFTQKKLENGNLLTAYDINPEFQLMKYQTYEKEHIVETVDTLI